MKGIAKVDKVKKAFLSWSKQLESGLNELKGETKRIDGQVAALMSQKQVATNKISEAEKLQAGLKGLMEGKNG